MASPESCRGDILTEKNDTYGLGFLIFVLLTSRKPHFLEMEGDTIDDAITKLIVSGVAPSLPETIENSQDPVIVTMKTVMWKAMEDDTEKRPTANLLA